MKIKNLLFIAIILLIGGLTNDLIAQEHLKAVIKKCESADNVDVTVVRQKDKETLKVKQSITTIRIPFSHKLTDEILAAFEKDEPSAYEVIYSKKNGKIVPQFFRFKNVSFSLSINNNRGILNFSINGNGFKSSSTVTGFKSSSSTVTNTNTNNNDKVDKNTEYVNITMIET
ncbi:MAG: DUF5024 domain-containing protein [Dysgonamonadaceae bacterium]|jgi:hypothetical protein|nr:DUF5024 domain-containing protein [Dysgonamonadaceae bacterium]